MESEGRLTPEQVRHIKRLRWFDICLDRGTLAMILGMVLWTLLWAHNIPASFAWFTSFLYMAMARPWRAQTFLEGWRAGTLAVLGLVTREAPFDEVVLVLSNPPTYRQYMNDMLIDLESRKD